MQEVTGSLTIYCLGSPKCFLIKKRDSKLAYLGKVQINYTDNLMNHKFLMFPIFVQDCNFYVYFTVDSKRKHVMIDIEDKFEDVNQLTTMLCYSV